MSLEGDFISGFMNALTFIIAMFVCGAIGIGTLVIGLIYHITWLTTTGAIFLVIAFLFLVYFWIKAN